jgi:sec-independent protein translocase protein TatB
MFGIDSSELLVVALVALLVIGPKDLPRVMRMVGQWAAKGRAMTRHVRAGFDTMMREAELEEMQKAWAAQNEAIMKASALPDLGLKDVLPDLSVPNHSADEWMGPAPATLPEPAAEPPAAEAPAEPKKRSRRGKPAEAVAAAATDTPPPKPKKPRRKAEPQETDTLPTEP